MAKELETVALDDILPVSIKDDSEVAASATSLDPFLQYTAALADGLPILSRIDELDESWLDLLAWQWHADWYDLDLTLDEKRALVKRLLIIHRYKGTLYAVRTALEPFEYDVEVDEYTGEHHLFDVSVEPLKDGADLGDVVTRAMDYINSAKAATRHIRNFQLHLNAPEVDVIMGTAPVTGEYVTVYPTVYATADDATVYAASGVDYDIEIIVQEA